MNKRKYDHCLCHDKKIKRYSTVRGKRRAHCPVMGHFCSTYKTNSAKQEMSFSEQVNTVTERRMMPKIADTVLATTTIFTLQLERVFIDNVKEFDRLDRTCAWYERLNPWSRFNRLALEIARYAHKPAKEMETQLKEKSVINVRRVGTLTKPEIKKRYQSVVEAERRHGHASRAGVENK